MRSIVRPVKKINETAIKIAKGDLGARIEDTGGDDEIGQLCESINNMAHEIKESERMKNEFISTVSHELRTPLTAIKGWGETILEDPIKDEALTKRGLNVIISESERLTSLVEELLDFSRMENGNLTMRMSSMDVLAELDEAVFVFKDRSMREGKELCFWAIGSMVQSAVQAADKLKEQGIDAGVVNMRFAKPLDKELLIEHAKRYGKIVTLEEGVLAGGVGSEVLEILDDAGLLQQCAVLRLGIPDEFVTHGDKKLLFRDLGLDTDAIVQKAAAFVKGE